MNEVTQCKVIKILDDKNILIDYGRIDGASKKDVVRVIEKGQEVEYNGEILGTLDNVKAELSIKVIYDKFSLCQNFRSVNSNVNTLANTLYKFYDEQPASLKVNEDQIENIKIPDNNVINVGDIVEIIRF